MMIESQLFFERKEMIGEEGLNSETYIAYDKQLNTDFVVKEIKKSTIEKEDEFFKEARMLYICDHPNICKIQWATQEKEKIFFSMPYYKKGSLTAKISNGNYLTNREIIKYSLDILSGLHFIHSRKLVHFDIKPSNILIDDSNKALITDFGLSKFLDKNLCTENDIFYTKHRPPEALGNCENLTVQADIYQFGMTLYAMCNGKEHLLNQINEIKSRENFHEKVLSSKFPDRKKYKPHIIPSLIKIINKCLEVDLEKRYNSVIEIMNDFSKIGDFLDWNYSEEGDMFFLKTKNLRKEIILQGIKKENDIEIKTTIQYYASNKKINKADIVFSGKSRAPFFKYIESL